MKTINQPEVKPLPPKKAAPAFTKSGLILVVFLIVVFSLNSLFLAPPENFPAGKTIVIKPGQTVAEIAQTFGEQSVVRSPLLFETLVRLSAKDDRVVAGEYFFNGRLALFEVIKRVTGGKYGLDPIRIMIPEGATVKEVGLILAKQLPDITTQRFTALAVGLEGYLFPDTYYFLPIAKEEEAIKVMSDNFQKKLEPLIAEIDHSGHKLHEVLTMASLLEEEARTDETRRMISGILWKRLTAGMPLQVDAVFPYIIGKNTFQVTRTDLQTDSPYNTYRYKGLPPGPISNPGLRAIKAALEPKISPYWFYLSDYNGNMHYAINFDQHKINKLRYLR